MDSQQLPVLALAGRPNVGKSSLFNRLTHSRDALVADTPGLTRDRQYGYSRFDGPRCIVIDTGGLTEERGGLAGQAAKQTLKALEEADAIAMLVDARAGANAADEEIARLLRRSNVPVHLVVNKSEGRTADEAAADFHRLGLGQPLAVSAQRGRGLTALLETMFGDWESPAEARVESDGIAVAVVGRPNVGKSTLVNRMLAEERVVASDEPGTTRDSIATPFTRDGVNFTLIDTAGLRRRSRVSEKIEKFSVVKTMQAIDRASVVIVLMDARQSITAQDMRLVRRVIERGRGVVIGLNKWDGMAPEKRENVRNDLDFRLRFLDYAPVHLVSALHGTGVGELLDSAEEIDEAAARDLPTPGLNRVLERALTAHPPPEIHGRRIKLRYAHQGGSHPPSIVIHGNQTEALPRNYIRYLENTFRQAFELHGTPMELVLRSGENPWENRASASKRKTRRKPSRGKFG